MSDARNFDAIVVGGGQAGPSLAARLAAADLHVAMVERKWFGGTCVNTGCRPTKSMVAGAKAAHLVRRSADFGVVGATVGGIDMGVVHKRRDDDMMHSRAGIASWLGGMKNITVIRGHARFVAPTELEVSGQRITAPKIFLNVGARPVIPDLPGLDKVDARRVLTNSSLLALTEIPAHLLVVGGSYIGLEFGQMYRRFGSKVTIVERGAELVAREDDDVTTGIRAILAAEDITVRTNAECIHLAPHADGIAIGLDCQSDLIAGSHVLLAVGRRPNTDDLGLDKAGVKVDKRGYIEVDETLETSVPGIWAMGDCNGKGAFTHTAYNDYEIVAANLLDGQDSPPRKWTDRIVTYGLFIDPPLGRCGMTEKEALAAGKKIKVGKRAMTRVARAVEKLEPQGFMKIIVDAESEKILGAAILGSSGDEAVQEILATMYAGGTARTLTHTVGIHPTVAELIPTIAGELKPQAPAASG